MAVEPRKTLTLKKPVIIIDEAKESAKAAKMAAAKVKQAMSSRLHVHKKTTTLLAVAKHPMRIMQLSRMIDRLNRILLTTNKITVKYVDDKQIVENV